MSSRLDRRSRRTAWEQWIVAALLGLLLTACVSAPQTARLVEAPPEDLPRQVDISQAVPFYPQEELYCGPAALAMAVSWSGRPVSQEEMAPQVYTPGREGTLRSDMLSGARRNGRLAVPVGEMESLLTELAAGHPVIVFQNLGLSFAPQWHYAVAVGHDLDREVILLHSGLTERQETPLDTFEATWARGDHWGLLVLPPDELPVTADLTEVLQAAVALERVDRPQDAEQSYMAILERWPESLAAGIGLGNARYAQEDYGGSAEALRRTTERHPSSGVAWHNLAVALSAAGRLDEAEAAALQAIELDDREAFQETLERIRGQATS